MKSIKVSIGVLSYNNAKFLADTIDSILSQTYESFEVVIVDDGSSDESLRIAQEFAQKDSRVSVYTHANHINKGISATCNLAIEKSQGEYVALLGSDDMYYPYTIEEQAGYLDNNPDVGVVCGIAQCIDAKGIPLAKTLDENIWSEDDYLEKMILGNHVAAPTVMVRKQCYEEIGLYDEQILYSDYELWLRILIFSNWKIGFIEKPLVLYRVHDTNVSLHNTPSRKRELELLVYLKIDKLLKQNSEKFIASPSVELIKDQIVKYSLDIYYSLLEEAKISKSLSYLYKYLTYNPKIIFDPRRLLSIKYRLVQGITKSLITNPSR